MVHYIPPDFRTRDIYSMIYLTQKKRSKIGQMNHTLEMACKRPLIIKGIKTIRLGVWLVWVLKLNEANLLWILSLLWNCVNAPYGNCTEYQIYCKYVYYLVMFALDSVSNCRTIQCLVTPVVLISISLFLVLLRSWQS